MMWNVVLSVVMRCAKQLPFPVLMFAAGAMAGWWFEHEHCLSLRNKAELDRAVAVAAEGRRNYERLVTISNELDDARARAVDLRSALERVRKSAADARKQNVACGMDAAAVARCERLLRESTELLTEGGTLLQDNAARHDALSKAVVD